MSNYIDLTGQRFGRLTVVRFAHSDDGAFWECRCDCGNSRIEKGAALRRGTAKRCSQRCPMLSKQTKQERAAYYRSWRERNATALKTKKSAYNKVNRAQLTARARERRQQNPENDRLRSERWRNNNPARRREVAAAWATRNPGKLAAQAAKRRVAIAQATPVWADVQAIKQMHADARSQGLVIDHIIPILNPFVCGLNVPCNLRSLDWQANSKKSNRFIPEVVSC